MDSRLAVAPLAFKAAVVYPQDLAVGIPEPGPLVLPVLDIRPGRPPGPKLLAAVEAAVFAAGETFGPDAPHGDHKVGMVIHPAPLAVWGVDRIVDDKPPTKELFTREFFNEGGMPFNAKTVGESELYLAGKLGVFALLGPLDFVPEPFAVVRPCRRTGRGDNAGSDDPALCRVVVECAVALVVEGLAGAVGGAGDRRTPGSAPDDLNRQMVVTRHANAPKENFYCLYGYYGWAVLKEVLTRAVSGLEPGRPRCMTGRESEPPCPLRLTVAEDFVQGFGDL